MQIPASAEVLFRLKSPFSTALLKLGGVSEHTDFCFCKEGERGYISPTRYLCTSGQLGLGYARSTLLPNPHSSVLGSQGKKQMLN